MKGPMYLLTQLYLRVPPDIALLHRLVVVELLSSEEHAHVRTRNTPRFFNQFLQSANRLSGCDLESHISSLIRPDEYRYH
jgi:hypothetical protein